MVLMWLLFAVLAPILSFGCYVAWKVHGWASPKMPPVPTPVRTGKTKDYTAERPEVVIIGGGVVGATMAIQFGKQGRQVVVFERQMQPPDRIVGEFLQPGGFHKMVQLGIDGTFVLSPSSSGKRG